MSSTTGVRDFSISAFPQGSLWRERPPEGSVYRAPPCAPVNARRCRTSGKKRGVAPSTITPYRAARRRAWRGRDARGRRPTTLYRRGLGESVPTHVRCGFPGIASTTAARAAPSDSTVLWLPNACTTCVRHPTLVRWPPIRRHGLDPQRRKSSIDPAPIKATSWRSTTVPSLPHAAPLWQGSAPADSWSSAASWKRRSPLPPRSPSSNGPSISTRTGPSLDSLPDPLPELIAQRRRLLGLGFIKRLRQPPVLFKGVDPHSTGPGLQLLAPGDRIGPEPNRVAHEDSVAHCRAVNSGLSLCRYKTSS